MLNLEVGINCEMPYLHKVPLKILLTIKFYNLNVFMVRIYLEYKLKYSFPNNNYIKIKC